MEDFNEGYNDRDITQEEAEAEMTQAQIDEYESDPANAEKVAAVKEMIKKRAPFTYIEDELTIGYRQGSDEYRMEILEDISKSLDVDIKGLIIKGKPPEKFRQVMKRAAKLVKNKKGEV